MDQNKLCKICLKENLCFSTFLLGTCYCKLGMDNHEVKCKYFGEKDHNEINVCKYFNKFKRKREIFLKENNINQLDNFEDSDKIGINLN